MNSTQATQATADSDIEQQVERTQDAFWKQRFVERAKTIALSKFGSSERRIYTWNQAEKDARTAYQLEFSKLSRQISARFSAGDAKRRLQGYRDKFANESSLEGSWKANTSVQTFEKAFTDGKVAYRSLLQAQLENKLPSMSKDEIHLLHKPISHANLMRDFVDPTLSTTAGQNSKLRYMVDDWDADGKLRQLLYERIRSSQSATTRNPPATSVGAVPTAARADDGDDDGSFEILFQGLTIETESALEESWDIVASG